MAEEHLEHDNPADAHSDPSSAIPKSVGAVTASRAPAAPAIAARVAERPSRNPAYPIILGLGFLAVIALAWYFGTLTPEALKTATAPATTASPSVADDTLSKDLKAIQAKVDDLGGQLKDLQARVESLPKPEPAPDIAQLKAKVDDLTKATESIATLSQKVGDLDKRFGEVDKVFQTIQDGFALLRGEVEKVAKLVSESATQPKPERVPAAGPTLAQGIELFKAGRYGEAREVFRTLQAMNPEDARVWYYAALANGQMTKNWRGETEELVKKGVEREKAGTPETASLDAAFSNRGWRLTAGGLSAEAGSVWPQAIGRAVPGESPRRTCQKRLNPRGGRIRSSGEGASSAAGVVTTARGKRPWIEYRAALGPCGSRGAGCFNSAVPACWA
jgi:hypothetical protein